MTELKVEAGDRALETARKIRGMFGDGDNCAICKATVAKIAALIQSAMNAQEREMRDVLQVAYDILKREVDAPFKLTMSTATKTVVEWVESTERLLAERGEGR